MIVATVVKAKAPPTRHVRAASMLHPSCRGCPQDKLWILVPLPAGVSIEDVKVVSIPVAYTDGREEVRDMHIIPVEYETTPGMSNAEMKAARLMRSSQHKRGTR